jgi:hypothetical protein
MVKTLRAFILCFFTLLGSYSLKATTVILFIDPYSGVQDINGPLSSVTLSVGDTLAWFYFNTGNPLDYTTVAHAITTYTFDDNNFVASVPMNSSEGYGLPGTYNVVITSNYSIDDPIDPINNPPQLFVVNYPFTINLTAPLQIHTTAFSGEVVDGHATLKWKHLSQNQDAKAIVLQSKDAVHFSPIAEMQSKAGENIFTDPNLLSETSYYQLQFVETNNAETLSEIIRLDLPAETFTVYPNPITNQINVLHAKPIKSVIVYNALGKIVLQSNSSKAIDASSLASGVYHVVVMYPSGVSKSIPITKL